jgi:hypothetical protein
MFGATAALELPPMIANAEAALTSLKSPASHAGFSISMTIRSSFRRIAAPSRL